MRRLQSSNFRSGDWTWEIYQDFQSAEKIWREFEPEAACYVFQTFDWLSRWMEIVGTPVHAIYPYIIIVKEKGEFRYILPLGVRRDRGFNILEWLGGNHADYHGPLVSQNSPPNSFTEVWKLIEKTLPKFDAIFFQRQPAKINGKDSPFVGSSAIEYIRAYSVLMEGRTWEQYQIERVKPKLRADSRRHRNQLNKLGDLNFVVASDRGTAGRILQIMFDQKRRRYRETGHSDMLAVKEYRRFYEKMTDDLVESQFIHLSALQVNDKVIATHWGALYRNCLYSLMPSFEGGEWPRYSPGRLLLEDLLEWCFDNAVEKFDFTGGLDKYKLDWRNHEMPLYYYMGARSLKGIIYVTSHQARRFISRSFIGPFARSVYRGLGRAIKSIRPT